MKVRFGFNRLGGFRLLLDNTNCVCIQSSYFSILMPPLYFTEHSPPWLLRSSTPPCLLGNINREKKKRGKRLGLAAPAVGTLEPEDRGMRLQQ